MDVIKIRPNVMDGLSDETRERLSKLATWDFGGVARRAQRRCGWSNSELRAIERAYRRFLILVAIDPGATYGMNSGPVDEIWHEHILHTLDYERMCRDVFGRMVHHCPLDADQIDAGITSQYVSATLPALRRVFGARSSRFWPADEAPGAFAKCCNHIGERVAA